MVEYALLAGFIAVAAGAALPGISGELASIFKQVYYVLLTAAGRSPTGSSQF